MKIENFKHKLLEFASRRVVTATPLIVLSSMMVTSYLANPVMAVTIDGEFIGNIESSVEFEQQISNVEKMASEILGKPYNLDIDKQYKIVYGQSKNILAEEEATEILSSQITEITTMAIITVDGKELVATKTAEEAEMVLKELLNEATSNSGADGAHFVENIEVVEDFGNINLLKDIDGAKLALTQTEQAPAVHKAGQGETLSEIANSYGLRTSEVETLNPGIEPTKMQIGQDIIVQKSKPAISVEVVKVETTIQKTDYKTETQPDDSMTTTQKKTLKQGVQGENKIVANVTYIDGQEVAREVVSTTVLSQPQDALVAVGTKKAVSTGAFGMPTRGATLTSKYGYRSGGFHTGIDLASKYGTTIVASDGGKVVFSGWNGGYGNCVIIDHGNGYETLYAHNSKNVVKKGDKVSKGDKIAEMGSTGNSTGNHVHFEVRKNGKHQNPYNYL